MLAYTMHPICQHMHQSGAAGSPLGASSLARSCDDGMLLNNPDLQNSQHSTAHSNHHRHAGTFLINTCARRRDQRVEGRDVCLARRQH